MLPWRVLFHVTLLTAALYPAIKAELGLPKVFTVTALIRPMTIARGMAMLRGWKVGCRRNRSSCLVEAHANAFLVGAIGVATRHAKPAGGPKSADLLALGVIYYRAFTGAEAFLGPTALLDTPASPITRGRATQKRGSNLRPLSHETAGPTVTLSRASQTRSSRPMVRLSARATSQTI